MITQFPRTAECVRVDKLNLYHFKNKRVMFLAQNIMNFSLEFYV